MKSVVTSTQPRYIDPAPEADAVARVRVSVLRRALLIALLYAISATLWIYYSDRALGLMFDDQELMLRWSVYKGIGFVVATALMLLLLMWWAFRTIELNLRSLQDAQLSLRSSQAQLSAIIASAMDAIVVVDSDLRVLLFNAAAQRMFSCTHAEALQQPLEHFISDAANAGTTGSREMVAVRSSGEHFPVDVSLSRGDSGSQTLLTLVIRDISLRRTHETEIERMNRLYSALGRINQALLRVPDRDALFNSVCRVLVDDGGLSMAWLGWHDLQNNQLLAVARAGHGVDFIDTLCLSLEQRVDRQGPALQAFRDSSPFVFNDIIATASKQSWGAAATQRGFRACAAFPIHLGGRVCGVLAVYADEAGFFQPEEIALLRGASADITVALETLSLEDERRKTEMLVEAERLFSDTMIESMPGILYFYTREGKMLRWNRNFERVSGYSAAEMADMHPLEFTADSDRGDVERQIERVFEAGESFIEAPFRSRDGTTTPYYFTGRRVQFQGQPCLVGVGIDISERIQAEQALRELNDTLEFRVSTRTAELEVARVRAEAADRLKSAFLATMSHELRTPLNSIIGFTGIVLQRIAGPLNDEQARQLGMVRSSARHLLDLINDVLDLSRIEADQMDLHSEPFDLHTALERVVEMVRPMADAKQLALSSRLSDVPHIMVGDQRRFEQILLNLLNNAIKFTESGSVMLDVETVDGDAAGGEEDALSAVRVTVCDTGMGIKSEDLSLLFKPFSQIDTGLSRQHEGSGLGLAICHRLAALMGGRIEAASEWGQGSEFMVTLPLPRSAHQ